ncbi:MAG: DUF2723 domain-containing protein [Chloroflexi bacterium]|nr:MAG: DUF2723 domain-containing protein [Chloroflexota bacterium]
MTTLRTLIGRHETSGLLIVLAILTALYLSTLQTIPNGSDHYFMIDVGETQIVLNTWGSLHATGYPLYVITGNLIVALLTSVGMSAVVAPALVSLLWGIVALTLIYIIALHISHNMLAALLMVMLFGLTRTMWIHNVIAEIYTMGLALLAMLLLIAMWRGNIAHRVYWLAFIGGVGVAHHRALALVAPALLYAVGPELWRRRREWPKLIGVGFLLGIIGFVPYIYLPLRERAGAAWVYGQPDTVPGFLNEFLGREANRFFGIPDSFEMLRSNIALINRVLVTDVTMPGIIFGIAGLVVALLMIETRRAAVILSLNGGAAYLFHGILYSDVLSALILPVTLSLAFGWLFLLRLALSPSSSHTKRESASSWRILRATTAVVVAVIVGSRLFADHKPFITAVTTQRTGLETIDLARQTPPHATLMIPWGMRHFAVGFARDVRGDLQDITLVDHNADFASLVAQGQLVTLATTFFDHPVEWWTQRIGQPVTLQAAAPQLVEVTTRRELFDALDSDDEMVVVEQSVECTPGTIELRVDWVSAIKPQRDLSVFVHSLDTEGNIIAQGDQAAPVFGQRPLTTWQPHEIVHDLYTLPYADDAAAIHYGFFEQLPDGSFNNIYDFMQPMTCAR